MSTTNANLNERNALNQRTVNPLLARNSPQGEVAEVLICRSIRSEDGVLALGIYKYLAPLEPRHPALSSSKTVKIQKQKRPLKISFLKKMEVLNFHWQTAWIINWLLHLRGIIIE